MDDLLHGKPSRGPLDLTCFLKRSQKCCEPSFVLRIQVADPRPCQPRESLLQLRHVLRFAEELEPHSKVGIQQTGQSIHCRAAHALGGTTALSHLVAKIFKNRQKDRGLVLKMQVYRALGYLRRLGNVIDGSLAITVPRKQL